MTHRPDDEPWYIDVEFVQGEIDSGWKKVFDRFPCLAGQATNECPALSWTPLGESTPLRTELMELGALPDHALIALPRSAAPPGTDRTPFRGID